MRAMIGQLITVIITWYNAPQQREAGMCERLQRNPPPCSRGDLYSKARRPDEVAKVDALVALQEARTQLTTSGSDALPGLWQRVCVV